jgi:hypothetical protein
LLAELTQQGAVSNGNGPANGNDKLSSFNKRQSEFLLQAIVCIVEKLPALQNRELESTAQDMIDWFTQDRLAGLLKLSSGAYLYNRPRTFRVDAIFPGARSWYDSFIKFVVRHGLDGNPPENILSHLLQLPNRRAA